MSNYTIPIMCDKGRDCKNYPNNCEDCRRYADYNILLDKENKDKFELKK